MARVIVAGAGISGLVAADKLHRDAEVLVLEARSRIGGRMVRTISDLGLAVDLGGQWVGHTQDHLLRLAERLDVGTFPQYTNGNDVIWFGGKSYEPTSGQEGEVSRIQADLEKLAKPIDPSSPWHWEGAAGSDQQTLRQWIERASNDDYVRFAVTWETAFNQSGASAGEVSLLHTLFETRANPSEEKPDEFLFYGGAGQIPGKLADAAGLRGKIRLDSKVAAITWTRSGVRVTLAGGESFDGDAAIVAMPPHLTAAITYDPPLDARRLQLTQRMAIGTIVKIACVYRSKWWRDRGFSGTAKGGDATLTVQAVVDSSPPPQVSDTPGILTCFIQGDRAIAWCDLDAPTRRSVVLGDLRTYFGGGGEIPLPSQFIEQLWPQEQFTGGAYNAYLPPGGWTSYGSAIRQPIGRIFWAGTETATQWYGYFDGAISAGERAAKEVRGALGL